MTDIARLKTRRETAKRERDQFQPLIDECYQYGIPFRKGLKNAAAGERRTDLVFDHTAVDAAVRFAGKVQQDFWPAGQQNFELEPGPVVIDEKERDTIGKALAGVTAVCQAFFEDGDFDLAFHEMALDLTAGTGFMLMNGTDDPEKLWEPISVPIEEMLLESGPGNRLSGLFWDRKMSFRLLSETYPDGDFGEALKKGIADTPEQEIEVHLDTVFERSPSRRWRMLVWCDKQDKPVWERESRTCPWLAPRYFRVPGETYGRGVLMISMPTIKTTNTAARLQLQAAAIALLGIYTAVDDGVFNPDLAPLEPGVFWKVARNGGVLGPSVTRFPDPRLDLSNIVLNDLRMGIKATMMDQSLPADGAAVRSATEIMERVKRLAADHLGAYGRLVKEITVPAVKRAMELAYERGLIPQTIPIDALLVKIRVKSPLALAREAQRLEKIIQWLQMVLALAGASRNPGMALRVAKVEQALVRIGHDMGVPAELIVTAEEREAMDQQQQQAAVLAAGAAALGGGAPA